MIPKTMKSPAEVTRQQLRRKAIAPWCNLELQSRVSSLYDMIIHGRRGGLWFIVTWWSLSQSLRARLWHADNRHVSRSIVSTLLEMRIAASSALSIPFPKVVRVLQLIYIYITIRSSSVPFELRYHTGPPLSDTSFLFPSHEDIYIYIYQYIEEAH